MQISKLTMLVLAVAFITSSHAEENWPSFRNAGTSVIRASDVPVRWSPDSGVAWRSRISGYGQSSPVVWEGRVYLTSSDGPFQEHGFVHAFDLRNGEKLWTSEVTATTQVENYFRNSRAAPTCVVDSKRVISFFASGDVTSMDHDGKTLWTVPLFKMFGIVDNERGTASSLAQTSDVVIVLVDHGGASYLVALSKDDGSVVWKTLRPNRVPSWSSPVVMTHDERELIVVSSADSVSAYEAESGTELWKLAGFQGNHIPSATVAGDSIYIGSTEMFHGDYDPDRVAGSNCRIDLTGQAAMPFEVRWGAERANSYYSSPLAFAGYVYYVNKAGVLYCVDQQTGKQVFAKRIGNPCWASAIGVKRPDGQSLVYFVTKNGFTIVLRPGDEYDQVARNQLWDREQMVEAAEAAAVARSKNAVPPEMVTPKEGPEKVFAGMPESQLHQMFSYGDPTAYAAIIVDGNLLVRTGQHLYCVRGDGTDP